MAENTKIEWADHTFNPWIGCTKVSPACDHCYAEAGFDKHRKVVKWGAGQARKHTAPSTWAQPLRWNAEAKRLGVRYRVFCASLADWADNAVPGHWRLELAHLIRQTSFIDWLLLTKRIGNAAAMLAEMFPEGVPRNVRIGATICNQPEADRDIPKLVSLGLPNFISIEPLLGPVDLGLCDCDHGSIPAPHNVGGVTCPKCNGAGGLMVDWVIVGGESGHNARPMHPDWARSLRDQCEAAGVPFLFKQWGEWTEIEPGMSRLVDPDSIEGKRLAEQCDGFISPSGEFVRDLDEATTDEPYRGLVRPGKKAAGRLLDGRTWDGVPS